MPDEMNQQQAADRPTEEQTAQSASAIPSKSGPEPEPADVGRRVTAAFIDLCVVAALFFFLGWLATLGNLTFIRSTYLFWLIPIAYALTRDMYANGRPLSIGKRLAKLDVITGKGQHPDFVNSIQRNILFFFPPLALCMAGLELYLIIRTKEHKRFGDYFGKTLVVQQPV
jgi:uncharacterized RDD family membrane protein YckC